jgi:oligopeptide/dipeptide ABC transporter ATP-binding protein
VLALEINQSKEVVMNIDQLKVEFENESGNVTALRNVSIKLFRGEIVGLVGESGCGKSLTSHSAMRLLPKNANIVDGQIEINGRSIVGLNENQMRKIRGDLISMIFQEPMTALNPLIHIGKQIEETLLLHRKFTKEERYKKVIELLKSVEIPEPERRYKQYPFELSGGMRQRVMIAMSLACNPKVIIADEPTTALDVTIQAQILDLLKNIRDEHSTSILLITHDMGVIADMADRVAVMYAGQVIEMAAVEEIFENPKHPYTIGLLNSIPDLTKDVNEELPSIPGSVPDLSSLSQGCPFEPRCSHATDKCRQINPTLSTISDNHDVACWHPN